MASESFVDAKMNAQRTLATHTTVAATEDLSPRERLSQAERNYVVEIPDLVAVAGRL